jgi:2-amino-4-hydroxy-6-hydroxymethyldihydropteridine diphosphokinase
MNIVYLSLGSNRGDRMDLIRKATVLIGERIGRVSQKSAIYETPPWGFEDSTSFYNCAIEVLTGMSPQDTLSAILGIEQQLGRTREPSGQDRPGSGVFLPRTIDIDILFYNDLILDSRNLVIPHPAVAARRFVLEPLSRICPSVVHPVLNMQVSELLQQCTDPSILTLVGEV